MQCCTKFVCMNKHRAQTAWLMNSSSCRLITERVSRDNHLTDVCCSRFEPSASGCVTTSTFINLPPVANTSYQSDVAFTEQRE